MAQFTGEVREGSRSKVGATPPGGLAWVLGRLAPSSSCEHYDLGSVGVERSEADGNMSQYRV